ncbi:OB-fold nucleic acid binding domain-containing protein [Longispora urticae]
MDTLDLATVDTWATGQSVDYHPVQFVRDQLHRYGAHTIANLEGVRDGRRVLVGGMVTHRQRPETAGGIMFLNLEDETGQLNVICSVGLQSRNKKLLRTATGLLIRGQLQSATSAINLVADKVAVLAVPISVHSRDFR